jgi:hypothetical protein
MATAAAAVVARARREVISHFMQSNAVSPASAVHWVPERGLERRLLARFVRRGVLVETGDERYYLDVPAYDDWRRSARRRAAVAIAGVTVLSAALVLLG